MTKGGMLTKYALRKHTNKFVNCSSTMVTINDERAYFYRLFLFDKEREDYDKS